MIDRVERVEFFSRVEHKDFEREVSYEEVV